MCLVVVSCTNDSRVLPAGEGRADAAGAAAGAKPEAPRETWDVYLLQGKRVGYGRTTVRREIEAGRAVVRTENTSHLSVKRGGPNQRAGHPRHERRDARRAAAAFRERDPHGTQSHPRHRRGSRQPARHGDARARRPTTPQRTSIDWPADCGGPFAIEQSLARKPMQPGERRTLKTLMAGFQSGGRRGTGGQAIRAYPAAPRRPRLAADRNRHAAAVAARRQ